MILILSNGYGEDLIGARLIRELNSLSLTPSPGFKVLPVVGMGRSYEGLGAELLNPRKEMPSGGFIRKPSAFASDLWSGLAGLALSQRKTLKRIKEKVELSICIGDSYVLWLTGSCAGGKIAFLPTAKSDYMEKHFWIEKWLMRRYAKIVLPRDELTARSLKISGINARYVGNALMDCFRVTGEDFGIGNGGYVLGLLPGSRRETYMNIRDLLGIIHDIIFLRLDSPPVFLLALAPSLSLDGVNGIVRGLSWNFSHSTPGQLKKGIIGVLRKEIDGIDVVVLICSKFGDVISRSDAIIGMAGSANEQAAGLGKPVITFPGRGPQARKAFLKKQFLLLGGAATMVKRKEVAREAWAILLDESRKKRMGEMGRKRMGSPGAIKRMATLIAEEMGL